VSGKIIEENGGRIEVESRPGEGSTFTIIVPEAAQQSSGETS
jgi:signal transduction histidine kinase